MKHRTLAKIGTVATVAALALTGCSGSGDGGDESGSDSGATHAVMYTANNETQTDIISNAAAALDPSLKVDIVSGSTGPILQRVQAEDGVNSADIFFSASREALSEYVDLFEPYESPEASALPEELIDPEHRWTATNVHVVGLMVNTDQLDGEAPASWKDLTDPSYKGKIVTADPTQSSTSMAALYGAYKVLGEADFGKLLDNVEITENSGNVYPAVAQGEYAVTLGYESNIYPYIAGGQAGVELVYPEDGTFSVPEAMVLFNKAANPEAGKRLIDTILAKETQEQLLAEAFRRPSRTDIVVSDFVDLPDMESLNIVPIDEDSDEQGREAFLAFWGSH